MSSQAQRRKKRKEQRGEVAKRRGGCATNTHIEHERQLRSLYHAIMCMLLKSTYKFKKNAAMLFFFVKNVYFNTEIGSVSDVPR